MTKDKINNLAKMSITQAIALYYEKHHALRIGNIAKLIKLKTRYPEIFDKKRDAELGDMVKSIKLFQTSDHYKRLRRKKIKEKLVLVNNYNKPE